MWPAGMAKQGPGTGCGVQAGSLPAWIHTLASCSRLAPWPGLAVSLRPRGGRPTTRQAHRDPTLLRSLDTRHPDSRTETRVPHTGLPRAALARWTQDGTHAPGVASLPRAAGVWEGISRAGLAFRRLIQFVLLRVKCEMVASQTFKGPGRERERLLKFKF